MKCIVKKTPKTKDNNDTKISTTEFQDHGQCALLFEKWEIPPYTAEHISLQNASDQTW